MFWIRPLGLLCLNWQPLPVRNAFYPFALLRLLPIEPTRISIRCALWTKKQALAGLPDIFGNGREQMRQQTETEEDELYEQIGRLKVELDFLKKRAGLID